MNPRRSDLHSSNIIFEIERYFGSVHYNPVRLVLQSHYTDLSTTAEETKENKYSFLTWIAEEKEATVASKASPQWILKNNVKSPAKAAKPRAALNQWTHRSNARLLVRVVKHRDAADSN